jgi:hypothetical protein
MSCKGLLVGAMKEYAAWAFKGKARLEFVVGDVHLIPEDMHEVAALGRGRVLFDFCSHAQGCRPCAEPDMSGRTA